MAHESGRQEDRFGRRLLLTCIRREDGWNLTDHRLGRYRDQFDECLSTGTRGVLSSRRKKVRSAPIQAVPSVVAKGRSGPQKATEHLTVRLDTRFLRRDWFHKRENLHCRCTTAMRLNQKYASRLP